MSTFSLPPGGFQLEFSYSPLADVTWTRLLVPWVCPRESPDWILVFAEGGGMFFTERCTLTDHRWESGGLRFHLIPHPRNFDSRLRGFKADRRCDAGGGWLTQHIVQCPNIQRHQIDLHQGEDFRFPMAGFKLASILS